MNYHSSTSQNLVRLAVAAVLAAPTLASAAVLPAPMIDFRTATPDVIKIAKELLPANVTSISGIRAVPIMPAPMSADYTVGGANSYYMGVVLSAGLKTTASPNLACKVYTGGTYKVNKNVATLQSGGAGSKAFTFAIKTGTTLAGSNASGYCYLISGTNTNTVVVTDATAGVTFTNSGITDKTIAWKTTRIVGGTPATVSAAAKSFITFVKGASASISVGSTGGLINVAANAMKLTSASTTNKPFSTTAAVAGVITFKNVAGVTAAKVGGSLTPPDKVNASAFVKDAILTLAGDPIASSKYVILASGIAGGDCAGTNKVASGVVSSGKVTFSGAALVANLAGAGVGVKVCLHFSGTTAISAGQITASLGSKSPSTLGYNPDFSFPDGAGNMLNLKKNGKSAKVFNLAPPPADATATTYDISNLRFTNLGSPGAVRATLYKGDGTTVASGVLLTAAEFPKNATVGMSYKDVLVKLGSPTGIDGTVPTGSSIAAVGYKRPWLQVDGEVSDMRVMHIQSRMVNGVPGPAINMSAASVVE